MGHYPRHEDGRYLFINEVDLILGELAFLMT